MNNGWESSLPLILFRIYRCLVVVPIEGAESVAVVRAQRVCRVALVALHPESIEVLFTIHPVTMKRRERERKKNCTLFFYSKDQRPRSKKANPCFVVGAILMNPVRAPKFSLSSCLLFVSHRTERMEKKYCHGIQDKIDLLVITLKNKELHDEKSTTRNAEREEILLPSMIFSIIVFFSLLYWESIGSSSRAWHEEGEGIVIHLNDSYSAKTLWSSKSHSSTRKTTSCSFVNLKIKTPIKSILNLFQSTF